MSLAPEKVQRYVPSFEMPAGTNLDFLEDAIALGEEEINKIFGEMPEERRAKYEKDIERFVAVFAALHVVRHRDLVLTSTGFGVVSNQNVAPASQARVDALAEKLRDEYESEKYYRILPLLKDDLWWRETPAFHRYYHNLFPVPMSYTASGISWHGKRVREEEMFLLTPFHDEAEIEVIKVMGEEQYRALVKASNGTGQGIYDRLMWQLRIFTKRFMAQIINRRLEGLPLYMSYDKCRPIYEARRKLIKFLNDNKSHFLPYLNSQEHKDYLTKRYENKKKYSCFFFH